MSETEAKVDEEASADESESTAPATTSGGTSNGVLSEQEQETLQDWALYLTGIFAAVGVAFGLNSVLQEQWQHSLVFFTGQMGPQANMGSLISVLFLTNVHLWLTITLPVVVLSGIVIARNVDNEEQTAFKVAGVTAVLGLLAVGVISGLSVALVDDFNVNLVNVIVSSLASGIAAAVGAAIAVYLTDEKAPPALH